MEPNTETQEVAPVVPDQVDPGQAPASPVASPAVDPSVSFNQQLQAQYGLTPEEIRNLKSGMNEAQREAAAAKKRLREVAPILEYADRDKSFMSYLYEQARSYPGDSGGQVVDPAVLGVLNPVQQEVRQLREQFEAKEFHEQMEALAKDFPDVMTADGKRQLAIAAEASGNYDLEFHFYKEFGKQLIAKARQQGTQQAVKTITDNNNVYRHSAPTTAIAIPVEIASMTEDQKKEWADKEIDKIMSDSSYATKIAGQVG